MQVMSTVTHLPAPGTPREIVATEIRALLGRHQRTQTDLAGLLNISQSQMSKRLRGVIPFDIDELASVAHYFGVSVGSLFGETTVNPGPNGPQGGAQLTGPYVTPVALRAVA